MCGIVGYIGKNRAQPILLEGLKRLEYRGYDSAGIAVLNDKSIILKKSVGKVEKLEKILKKIDCSGTIGIAHTRWATHGKPTLANAHPHCDCNDEIFVVHNGIIENYQQLKKWLITLGHKFKSETDTEVIAHLIEQAQKDAEDNAEGRGKFENAVRTALKKVQGAYGLVIISAQEPDKLIAARRGSPLLIGIGKDEYVVASDAAAIINRTKKVIYLEDNDLVIINRKGFKIVDDNLSPKNEKISRIDWTDGEITKNGYEHFMLKEIHEIKDVIINSTRGRIIESAGEVKLGGLEPVKNQLKNISRLIIVACGTARYAGMVGEYMIEEFAGIPVEVEMASEFRYRNPIIDKDTAVLAISQSGETADTLAAIREAKAKSALTIGIVNAVGSSIARETDAGVYNHIGPETAVASTKAFISQLIILALLTIFLGRSRDMSIKTAKMILRGISNLPKQLEFIFKQETKVELIARTYNEYRDFLFLGRKYNFSIALEGALKLKEISYIHAEGYATGEMKHGPIAMIDKNFPCVVIAPRDSVYDKNITGIEEIMARNGKIIAIISQNDKKLAGKIKDFIMIPQCHEMLCPILTVLPLQLLAYYIGVSKGYNVDKPRNLAKSVTVE